MAPAKINLSLDVLGLREDGFHELRSVMQTVSLADTIILWIGDFSDDHAASTDLYLIDQAIEAVREVAGVNAPPIAYSVEKRIPSAAGLGGGSSDCAAAIRGTAQLLDLNLSEERMHQIAVSLGSDVPFFLTGGAALVEGRGEKVTPLGPILESYFILANAGEPVSTGKVFAELRDDEYGQSYATERVLAALESGGVIFGGNDLDAPAIRVCPAIEHLVGLLTEISGRDKVQMSGSGGTVAALFDGPGKASAALPTVQAAVPFATLVTSTPR